MEFSYTGLDGESYTEHLQEVQVEGVLLHATPDSNVESIRQQGLKTNMPRTKLMADVRAVFCTIPSEKPSTADLFRYYDDWSIIVIDTEKIPAHRWYIDFLAAEDMSNHGSNQHVMTFEEIPASAIRKVLK